LLLRLVGLLDESVTVCDPNFAVFIYPALTRSSVLSPMRDRIGDDIAVALVHDADLSAVVIDRGPDRDGLGILRSLSPVYLSLDGHGSMMPPDVLIPARPVAIDPTFGRYPLAPIYLPADVAMTRYTGFDRMLQNVTAVPAAGHDRRHDNALPRRRRD
jgi:hypothetical protein